MFNYNCRQSVWWSPPNPESRLAAVDFGTDSGAPHHCLYVCMSVCLYRNGMLMLGGQAADKAFTNLNPLVQSLFGCYGFGFDIDEAG